MLMYPEITLFERGKFKLLFGGNVNARGALDQKVKAFKDDNTAKIK